MNNLPKPMDAFKSFHSKDSCTFRLMKSYGSKIAPLAVVGQFMNHAGNSLLHHIDKNVLSGYKPDERQVFFPKHAVQSITLLDNGDILTTAIRKYVDPEDKKEYEAFVQFKSKAIVLSNGAK